MDFYFLYNRKQKSFLQLLTAEAGNPVISAIFDLETLDTYE